MEKQHILMACAGMAVAAAIATGVAAALLFHRVTTPTGYLYVDADDTLDSLREKSALGWRFDVYRRLMKPAVRTGRYRVEEGMHSLELYRRLRNGQQEPLQLRVPSVRTLDRLAAILGHELMLDSATIADAFADSSFCQHYGHTLATLPALFIPNTYEVYWNTSLASLMRRLKQENDRYWNEERRRLAQQMGLSPVEVATLASIVDEETANNGEKPMIAGLYLNRLRKGMLLQADPTVKFAQGDWTLRRIYFNHLGIDNPYNTYKYKGLPPGPIRVASMEGLEAVLHHAEHNYLYMCAKEDFSGTHNFAATYAEHLRNARRYAKALNERNIR